MDTNETSHQTAVEPSCFLTTATVGVLGMSDDCEPLTLARYLRDEKMVTDSERAAVDLYYRVAPKVVAESTEEEWVEFWDESLREITSLVRAGEYELAKDLYTLATARLVDRKATEYSDKEMVEDVYRFGMDKLFGFDFTKALPYSVRFALLKLGMKSWVSAEQLRLRIRMLRVARIIEL